MVSDLDLARLAAAIYDPASRWDRVFAIADIRVGCKWTAGEGWRVAVRGTVPSDLENLRRDGDCLPVETPALGALHRGFYSGAMLFADALDQLVGSDTVVGTGHSLGAAMLLVYLARRRAKRLPVAYAATFGCPRVAFSLFGRPTAVEAQLADVIGPDYAHAKDPIAPEPLAAFRHARSNPPRILPTAICEGGAFDLNYHAVNGYILDLEALERAKV